ncbi:class I SAM-dependent methyltransferase [Rhodophyticola sp. CCM32]|uniref:class I SAM-dependent methyltransferase n=1 Tax=Rhodophyticola sp. CCM32 TaxID=2916397 RepID=UPI00107F62DC|nr:class I SAM-dependent methyltransferase [Rhodophyticola sp. CCM32]QBY01305.1 class I SAM-dependent methyltransferase [Rhodophyticola sp. CCM32]
MTQDDPRKAYWNEKYLEYWRSRVAEAGEGTSNVVSGDPNTEDDEVYRRVFHRYGFEPGRLLEVGCAWGRMFPCYKAYDLKITGADISEAMISAARESWETDEAVEALAVAPAEELPFADEYFDNLACLAVLDATRQNEALTEFLRVTRPGGRLYITGKNDLYHADDQEALAAEIGARKKNHPNFFTDVTGLLECMSQQGHTLVGQYYFERRGDFAAFKYVETPRPPFYEYLLVFSRGESFAPLPTISSAYSKAFQNQ